MVFQGLVMSKLLGIDSVLSVRPSVTCAIDNLRSCLLRRNSARLEVYTVFRYRIKVWPSSNGTLKHTLLQNCCHNHIKSGGHSGVSVQSFKFWSETLKSEAILTGWAAKVYGTYGKLQENRDKGAIGFIVSKTAPGCVDAVAVYVYIYIQNSEFCESLTVSKKLRRGCLPPAGMDVEKDEAASGVQQPTPLLCSTRLGLSIIGFFMFFHLYAQRVGMSVAIVSMVNQTAVRMMAAGTQNSELLSVCIPPPALL